MKKIEMYSRKFITRFGQFPLLILVIIAYVLYYLYASKTAIQLYSSDYISLALYQQFLEYFQGIGTIPLANMPFLLDTTWLGAVVLFVFALGLNYVSGSLIKFLFFKPRPIPYTYKNWFQKIDAGSFPSIHAANGFTVAFFGITSSLHLLTHTSVCSFGDISATIAMNTVGIVAVIGATLSFAFYTLVGLSRLVLGKHFPVDMVGGTALSMLMLLITLYFAPGIHDLVRIVVGHL